MAQGVLASLAPRGARQKPCAFQESQGPFARSRAPGPWLSWNRGQDAAVVPPPITVHHRSITVYPRWQFLQGIRT